MDAETAHYRVMSLFKFAASLPFGKSIIKMIYGFEDTKLSKESLFKLLDSKTIKYNILLKLKK